MIIQFFSYPKVLFTRIDFRQSCLDGFINTNDDDILVDEIGAILCRYIKFWGTKKEL